LNKESFEFSNIFSPVAKNLEERKNMIGEEKGGKNMEFNEEYHLEGRPGWICDLYLELDKYILGLKSGIRKEHLETYIKYSFSGSLFAYILIRKKGEILKIWVKVPYSNLKGSVPLFVRDYETTARRFGVMITFNDQRDFIANKTAMLDTTFGILEIAFKQCLTGKKFTKLREPLVVFKTSSINLSVGDDGYIEVSLKIHKSQKKLLERILQDTIYK